MSKKPNKAIQGRRNRYHLKPKDFPAILKVDSKKYSPNEVKRMVEELEEAINRNRGRMTILADKDMEFIFNKKHLRKNVRIIRN